MTTERKAAILTIGLAVGVDMSLRWVPELSVEKRCEGDGVLLSVGLNF